MRRRAPALPAPKSDAEAHAYLARYAELDAAVATREAERAQAHAATDAAIDAIVQPQLAELGAIAKLMGVWWAVRGPAITGGKRKSIEICGCHIGERTSPPKLKHAHGKDAAAVDVLLGTRFRKLLIRFAKPSLDKRVILKVLAIGDKLSATIAALGFSAEQNDSFFLERAAAEAVRPADAA